MPEPRNVCRVLNAEDFRFRAEFHLQDEFRLRDRISSSARPKPNFVFTRISYSGPIFVFKYRLRAQFELQLLANNFVFKSFGISASGGGRNRDPVSRVNAYRDPGKWVPASSPP